MLNDFLIRIFPINWNWLCPGSESGAVTTNEMTMSTESGSDLDSEDIPYETDESKFGNQKRANP